MKKKIVKKALTMFQKQIHNLVKLIIKLNYAFLKTIINVKYA